MGLVVTEGNYLLLDRPEWRAVRAELDEVWFLDIPEEVRRSRLLARHTAYGKTPAEAQAWVARVDDPNAALVAATRAAADRVIDPGDAASRAPPEASEFGTIGPDCSRHESGA